jgi:hypothetical protein
MMNENGPHDLTEDVDYYQVIYKDLGKRQAIIEFGTTGNILPANQIDGLYHEGDSSPASPHFFLRNVRNAC